MSRTVTALYDSRAEAEAARARLIGGAKIEAMRIIAKDTVAAVDTLQFEPDQAKMYREAIASGSHLLVAEIEAGHDPKSIVALLEPSGAGQADSVEAPEPDMPKYGLMGVTDERSAQPPIAAEQPRVEEAKREVPTPPPAVAPAPIVAPRPAVASAVKEAPRPRTEDELRIGTPYRAHGGARVRSVVRETPTEEQVALAHEHVDVDHRPSERRLSFEDVKAGGLLRERVFEIREMREEPVVTKEAFVREEVIVRKTVQERRETIRDTVRRTDVEIDDADGRSEQRGVLFGGRPERR